jgi:hypothetical protein
VAEAGLDEQRGEIADVEIAGFMERAGALRPRLGIGQGSEQAQYGVREAHGAQRAAYGDALGDVRVFPEGVNGEAGLAGKVGELLGRPALPYRVAEVGDLQGKLLLLGGVRAQGGDVAVPLGLQPRVEVQELLVTSCLVHGVHLSSERLWRRGGGALGCGGGFS